MVADDGSVSTHARGSENVQELFVRRFQSEDIDDSVDKMISSCFQELADDELVVLEDFIEGLMNCLLLVLDGVIEND